MPGVAANPPLDGRDDLSDKTIVLFDGVCNFCNGLVNFIIQRDRRDRFRFAPLQSDVGREMLQRHGLPADWVGSLVAIDDGNVLTRSAAALRIVRRMSGLWPALYVLILIPRPLRDWAYDGFARSRYRWFGRSDACRVPTAESRSRFLA